MTKHEKHFEEGRGILTNKILSMKKRESTYVMADETEMTGDKKLTKETHERIRMNEEEQNATRRQSLASCYYEKAKRGEARKLLRSKMDRTKMVCKEIVNFRFQLCFVTTIFPLCYSSIFLVRNIRR